MYGVLAAVVLAGAYIVKVEAQSDQPLPPPPERAPQEHEVRTALADLRTALERLQDVLERQHDQHKDELRDIQRQLDRIEGNRRLEDALAAIHRQER